ncbi:MAG: GDSL-like Lipase/Acylhydrolase [Marmoricola sp.]|nr:GDSL-like Lipase/Acylhydrolase [Marmoricola sp.]
MLARQPGIRVVLDPMRNGTVAALASALAAATFALVPGAAHATTYAPARVLIVGDSVTQGKVGDYTWRYRLWKTLKAAGKSVDFVGPHTGLYDSATNTYDNPGYADPNFDQDHAAWWGMSMTHIADRVNVHDLMISDQPDVVINNLGFNDLEFVDTPSQLIAAMSQFVTDVRAVNPHVSVILGELTQTWLTNGSAEPVVTEYNTMLGALAVSLDQPGARVIAAPRPADYVEYVDTYDPAHPNAAGEVKIGKEFSDVLATLPLPNIPAPAPVTFTGAAKVAVVARTRAARLSFATPAGATKEAIWKRDLTVGGHWHLIAYAGPSAHHYWAKLLRHHHRYAFRLRAYKGTVPSAIYSNRVIVRIT